jgi:hypothetical protein
VVNARKVVSGGSAEEVTTADDSDDSDGGDAACWAHLLCPDCGVVLDGSEHTRTCAVTPEMPLD